MMNLPERGARAFAPAGMPLPMMVGFVLLSVGLGWASFVHPMRGMNIPPWGPQSALAVGLLAWRPQAWWLVLVATCAEFAVRPADLEAADVVLVGSVRTAGFALSAALLARRFGGTPHHITRRDLLVFLLLAAVCALLTAVLQAMALAGPAAVTPQRMFAAVHRGWIAEMVALLVGLPLLLALSRSEQRSASAALWRNLEFWVIAVVSVACTLTIFSQGADEQFKYFYVLFLPVVWAATRFGTLGAVWTASLIQCLLILAVRSGDYRPLTVFELEFLVAALAATGLMLGVTVDEREETARRLQDSLRQSAAADMAAALAHELNQPLMALSSYARATQLIAARVLKEDRDSALPLLEVSGKLVQEAARASDVVKHLRDFFKSGSTQLARVDFRHLVQDVLRAQAPRASALDVALDCQGGHDIPDLLIDRVQMEVVLRNLIDNAVDAAAQGPDGARTVTVRLRMEGARVVVSILDSGKGLADESVSTVFDKRRSGKPGGMGIGLGISRSIIEAHGGHAWAEPGPGGRFHFSLQAEPAHD